MGEVGVGWGVGGAGEITCFIFLLVFDLVGFLLFCCFLFSVVFFLVILCFDLPCCFCLPLFAFGLLCSSLIFFALF